MNPTTTCEELLGRVAQIAPLVSAHAAEAEQDRTLSGVVVKAMLGAGLFGMSLPARFGGSEVDPVTSFRVVEAISRHDSAAGWNLNIAVAVAYALAWLPDDGAAEIATTPELVCAGSFNPPGAAVPVDGGYRVTGRWRFSSGCQHAKWLLFTPAVTDSDGPRLHPDGSPQQLFAFLPADGVQILDTWRSLGMRGTGSHDIVATELFVPARHTAALAPLAAPAEGFGGPLYRLTFWPPVALLAPPALGTARAAIDAFVELAGVKTPSFTGTALRDRQVVQRQVAQAEANLCAGRAWLYEVFESAWAAAQAGETIELERKLNMQLATSHAVACAATAVDLVCAAAGTSTIRDESPFGRHFRDIHTMTQHAFASAQRYESVGALMLGTTSDWGFFAL